MPRARIDLTGQKFDRLTVIKPVDDYVNPTSGQHFPQWLCRCDCGKTCVKRTSYLTSKKIAHKSCGCYRSDSNKGKNLHDLTGKRFGRLTVLSRADDGHDPNGKAYTVWHCRCDCGNELDVRAATLVNGMTKSCGCYKNVLTRDFEDLTGRKFGRWTVLGPGEPLRRYDRTYRTWACRCECGTMRDVDEQALLKGSSQSCGCLRNEKLAESVRTNISRQSLAEQFTCQYLDQRCIPYTYQMYYSELYNLTSDTRGADPSYDFLIHHPVIGDVLIDLWGLEHFRSIESWGGDERFRRRATTDWRKREFAHKLSIPYIAINTTNVKTYDMMRVLLENYLNGYLTLFNSQAAVEDPMDAIRLL